MPAQQGLYALIQFSPIPERMEFLNVGVALFVPEQRYVGVRLADNFRRVERLFGKQPEKYIADLKIAFRNRIELEFSGEFDKKKFEYFCASRANDIRLSKALAISVVDPQSDLDELFEELVGDDVQNVRLPKIATQLKREFDNAGVAEFVERPKPIELPEGVVISAPYAYEAGPYNLIDPVRLAGDPGDALKEAGKRAIEGEWLSRYSQNQDVPKKLIVVADFAKHTNAFYHAVDSVMAEHNVGLYRLDDIKPLIADIKSNSKSNNRSTKFFM